MYWSEKLLRQIGDLIDKKKIRKELRNLAYVVPKLTQEMIMLKETRIHKP